MEQNDKFAFGRGSYLEAGDLDVEYRLGYGWLYQKDCQKTMLQLDLYQQLKDKYEVIYLNQKNLGFSFSKKLTIKYIYNVDVNRHQIKTVSELSGELSEATMIRLHFQEEKERLEKEREQRVEEYRQKADNFERIMHWSCWTNEERYMMGQMDIQDYFSENVWRNYYETEVESKVNKEIYQKRFQAERMQEEYWNMVRQNMRHSFDEEETIRFMKVAEIAYLDKEIVAIAAYKSPQALEEVQCMESISLNEMEGKVYHHKILFHKAPDIDKMIACLMT